METGRRPLVPAFLLRPFADATGRLIMERRDRARRLLVPVEEAVAEIGTYRVAEPAGAQGGLDRVLGEIEARAAEALRAVLAGTFPPAGADRAALSVFVAVQILTGRGHRQELADAAEALDAVITPILENLEESGSEESGSEESVEPPPTFAAPPAARVDVLVEDGETVGVTLATLPRLARALAGRTWQLVRFAGPHLLTGDTPVILWGRAAAQHPGQAGLGMADEVRVPLDPRHALILARRAKLGEVVRELEERHARGLNRTVAEAARRWVYYHPESDPLERVELAPP